jgi:hypothetical protein
MQRITRKFRKIHLISFCKLVGFKEWKWFALLGVVVLSIFFIRSCPTIKGSDLIGIARMCDSFEYSKKDAGS